MESWTLKFDDTVENVIKYIGRKHWHYIYSKPSQFKEELAASLTANDYSDTLRFLILLLNKKASKDMVKVRNCGNSYIALELASIAMQISCETFIDIDLIISGLCILFSGLGKIVKPTDVQNVISKIDTHISKEKDIDKQVDGAKNSALIRAAKQGNIEEVKSLLSRGANIHSEDNVCCTALGRACCGDYDKIAKLLIDEGSEIQFENFAEHGWSALTHAANNGAYKCLALLIEAGADVDYKTKFSQTPLMIATIINSPSCVKLLIEAQADVNAKDYQGHTALYFAIREDYTEIVDMLKAAGAN